MATPELLSLLCAGTTNYNHTLVGGGFPVLTKTEFAGLLSGLSKPAVDFALAKYVEDELAERELKTFVIQHIHGWAVQEGWEIVRGRPTVYNMCVMSVNEAIRPNLCGTCHGTGFKGVKVCPTCSGLCYRHLRGTEIAEASGLKYQVFYHQWRGRYERIFQFVTDFDVQVRRQVDKNYS